MFKALMDYLCKKQEETEKRSYIVQKWIKEKEKKTSSDASDCAGKILEKHFRR